MKKCTKCSVSKPLEEFAKHSKRSDGLQAQCRECHRTADKALYNRSPARKEQIVARRKENIRENRRKVREYLQAHPCVDCGQADHRVLEFDHVTGTKHASLANMHAYSWSRIEQEIAKCEVRCANCHRIKTVEQFGYYADVP